LKRLEALEKEEDDEDEDESSVEERRGCALESYFRLFSL